MGDVSISLILSNPVKSCSDCLRIQIHFLRRLDERVEEAVFDTISHNIQYINLSGIFAL